MVAEQPEETPTRVTDKRGKVKKRPKPEMPTAQELLDQKPDVVGDAQSEFERQQREAEIDAQRAAEFEAMSPEDQQALLARQAAEAGTTPYAGGGIQTDSLVKHEALSAFVIVIELDGTANAMPLAAFDPEQVDLQRDITSRMMYRSCAEIMMDIETVEAAHTTVQMLKTVGELAASQQRQQAMTAQLQKRGMRAPRG